jgi:hypothetical protein
MDLIHIPPNTIGRANRHPASPQRPAPIRERVVRSTAPLGGWQGSLQPGELPPNVPEDEVEVGEGENVGVDSQESQTHSSVAERPEKLVNTEVCAHTEGGRR